MRRLRVAHTVVSPLRLTLLEVWAQYCVDDRVMIAPPDEQRLGAFQGFYNVKIILGKMPFNHCFCLLELLGVKLSFHQQRTVT